MSRANTHRTSASFDVSMQPPAELSNAFCSMHDVAIVSPIAPYAT